jgi:flagellar biosynthetic protein FliR
MGAVMATLPAFGEQSIPVRIRLGLTLCLTAAVLPTSLSLMPKISLAQGFGAEIMIGLILGLSLRFFVFAFVTAGSIIANATSLSQLFPQAGEPQPAISQLLAIAALALALALDLPLRLIAFLSLSYSAFPPGRLPDLAWLADWAASHADLAFALAFQLSMPFVIAAVLYNVALGVMNRAMPQLMVTFIGAPLLALGGLVLLTLLLPTLLYVWLEALYRFMGPISLARQ